MNLNQLFLIITFYFLTSISIAEEFFDLKNLRKGQKGYAETVFEGTEPEKFDIEVLGLWKDVYPSIDIILIKCSGDKVNKSLVAHGMSGSPVYIDNKLVGAMALSFEGKDIPIAGVTPIRSMLKTPSTSKVAGLFDNVYYDDTHLIPKGGLVTTASSNFSKKAIGYLNKTWKAHNLGSIVTGQGGYEIGLPESLDYKIKSGSMIGISLVKGLFAMTAFGTVTHVSDSSFVAFGHPFLGLGEVELPVFNAYTYIVLPMVLSSTKLVGIGKEIGVLTGDHIAGVSGNLGKRAKLIPVTITVNQKSKKRSQKSNFEVISHRDLSMDLIYAVTQSLIDVEAPYALHNLVDAKLTFKIDKIEKPFSFDLKYYKSQNPLAKDLIMIPDVVIQNPFKELKLESFSLDISLEHEKRVSTINKLWLDKPLSREEDHYTLFIELLKYNNDFIVISQPLTIPTRQLRGPITISVASGSQVPPFEYPNTYDEFIKFIREIYGPQDLVVTLTYSKKTLRLEGNELKNLPESARVIYEQQNRLKVTRTEAKERVILRQKEVIMGSDSIEVSLEQKGLFATQKQEGKKQ